MIYLILLMYYLCVDRFLTVTLIKRVHEVNDTSTVWQLMCNPVDISYSNTIIHKDSTTVVNMQISFLYPCAIMDNIYIFISYNTSNETIDGVIWKAWTLINLLVYYFKFYIGTNIVQCIISYHHYYFTRI